MLQSRRVGRKLIPGKLPRLDSRSAQRNRSRRQSLGSLMTSVPPPSSSVANSPRVFNILIIASAAFERSAALYRLAVSFTARRAALIDARTCARECTREIPETVECRRYRRTSLSRSRKSFPPSFSPHRTENCFVSPRQEGKRGRGRDATVSFAQFSRSAAVDSPLADARTFSAPHYISRRSRGG